MIRLTLYLIFIIFVYGCSFFSSEEKLSSSFPTSNPFSPATKNIEKPKKNQKRMSILQIQKHIALMDQNSDKFLLGEFPQGDWFNSFPLRRSFHFKNKIGVLLFWSYSSLESCQVAQEISLLNIRWKNKPVVFMGVHTGKFRHELPGKSVHHAIIKNRIEYPVFNDDKLLLWEKLKMTTWPTIVILGPKGNLLARVFPVGESVSEQISITQEIITQSLSYYGLESKPQVNVPLYLEKKKIKRKNPLAYPSYISIDSEQSRIFISDSGQNRIVIVNFKGEFLESIGRGFFGLRDGNYQEAEFKNPQGLYYKENKLYVADSGNHAIRIIDLEKKSVKTLASNANFDSSEGKNLLPLKMQYPWDLELISKKLYISMAGNNQIWILNIDTGKSTILSGTGKKRNYNDKLRLEKSLWAQPKGLSSNKENLFIADSDSSTIRKIDLIKKKSYPLVGGHQFSTNLFSFGDKDGFELLAQLQYPCEVLWWPTQGRLLVADTFNNKIKILDSETKYIDSWCGSGSTGHIDGDYFEASFFEPSGLAFSEEEKKIYIADTNNHAIRAIHLDQKKVKTLILRNVPFAQPSPYEAANIFASFSPRIIKESPLYLSSSSGKKVPLRLNLRLPAGTHFSSQSCWHIFTQGDDPLKITGIQKEGVMKNGEDIHWSFQRGKGNGILKLEVLVYFYDEKKNYMVEALLFEIPVIYNQGNKEERKVIEYAIQSL